MLNKISQLQYAKQALAAEYLQKQAALEELEKAAALEEYQAEQILKSAGIDTDALRRGLKRGLFGAHPLAPNSKPGNELLGLMNEGLKTPAERSLSQMWGDADTLGKIRALGLGVGAPALAAGGAGYGINEMMEDKPWYERLLG